MRRETVQVSLGPKLLTGDLAVPDDASGLVVFAHGSGSSRLSPRNRLVAERLNEAGFGTLLFDLLTADEEKDRSNVFDIPMLGDRLARVTAWVRQAEDTRGKPVGYFGASTGAAAALTAASDLHADISAVVSRGGRPDLAMDRLASVRSPTLLIVGGRDRVVKQLNREAQRNLMCINHLSIVPKAGHLFEEPGALAEVAQLATEWFATHFDGT